MAVCRGCGADKPHEEMVELTLAQDGSRGLCKLCQGAYNRAWRKKHAQHLLELGRGYRQSVLSTTKDLNLGTNGHGRRRHAAVR